VIGVSQKSKSQKPRFKLSQRGRQFAFVSLLIALISIFIFLLTISISLAGFYGVFVVLFIFILFLPPDKPPKELERTRRDIDRRALFIGGYGGGGKGLISFEGDGPTPHRPEIDEDKL